MLNAITAGIEHVVWEAGTPVKWHPPPPVGSVVGALQQGSAAFLYEQFRRDWQQLGASSLDSQLLGAPS